MCLVLDTCAIAAFFDRSNKDHADFKPALEWVALGEGKLVYGGTKYKREMNLAPSYLRFFAALDRAGKLVKLCDNKVNELQAQAEAIEPSDQFDDPHLIAIILASSCRIVCTRDTRAIPFLKDIRFYAPPLKRPRIYQSKRNAALLCDKYVADVCRPCKRLRRKIGEMLLSP